MSYAADREGTFRAEIVDYGLREQESGAVAVTIKAKLLEIWNSEEQAWEPWAEYGQEAYGDIWVIKKDGGGLNKNGVNSLVQCADWDGNFASIVNRDWHPCACQVVIKEDTYKEETRYKIAFLNDYDRTPGQLGSIDPKKAESLQARFGGELRALTGNAKRNATAPNGKPPAPPAAKRSPAPTADPNAELAAAGQRPNDDIPF